MAFFLSRKKSHRRIGIGTKLLKKIESKCSKNYPLIFVDISQSDYEAKRFYAKHKFRVKGKVKDWFDSGEWGIILSKKVV